MGGLAIGMASGLSPMYIAEAAPAEIRGKLVCLNELTIVRGMFLPYVVTEPKVSLRDFHVFAGSPTISKQMQNSGRLRQPLYLSEAISAVHTYAKTCVENQASVADCQNFGGTIHIATVTKEEFTWIEKPKNLKAPTHFP
jgi:hypothetical protein